MTEEEHVRFKQEWKWVLLSKDDFVTDDISEDTIDLLHETMEQEGHLVPKYINCLYEQADEVTGWMYAGILIGLSLLLYCFANEVSREVLHSLLGILIYPVIIVTALIVIFVFLELLEMVQCVQEANYIRSRYQDFCAAVVSKKVEYIAINLVREGLHEFIE